MPAPLTEASQGICGSGLHRLFRNLHNNLQCNLLAFDVQAR
jgi:hypothetical protein